jgi:hypothetical protein
MKITGLIILCIAIIAGLIEAMCLLEELSDEN